MTLLVNGCENNSLLRLRELEGRKLFFSEREFQREYISRENIFSFISMCDNVLLLYIIFLVLLFIYVSAKVKRPIIEIDLIYFLS